MMPPTVFSGTDIEALSLYQTTLHELPDTLWQLTRLKTLNLGDNRITSLPDRCQGGSTCQRGSRLGPELAFLFSQD